MLIENHFPLRTEPQTEMKMSDLLLLIEILFTLTMTGQTNRISHRSPRGDNQPEGKRTKPGTRSEPESELFIDDTSNDNHSPGPVIRGISP